MTDPRRRAEWQRLRAVLLEIDGEEVAVPGPGSALAPFLRLLPERGREYLGLMLLRPGSAPNACHRNVARAVRRGEAATWCYGFALYDATWHEHSWGLDDRGEVIETTIPARRYYGIELPSFAAAVAG